MFESTCHQSVIQKRENHQYDDCTKTECERREDRCALTSNDPGLWQDNLLYPQYESKSPAARDYAEGFRGDMYCTYGRSTVMLEVVASKLTDPSPRADQPPGLPSRSTEKVGNKHS
jgi:hypothetical protein